MRTPDPSPFPRVFRARQTFAATPPLDRASRVREQLGALAPSLKPGARIAIGVGSRGIANLAGIVAEALATLKAAGAEPFIVPAMGSHGGATPEGQTRLLADYGVTESALGVPIRAAMDVECLGRTSDGVDLFCSAEALRADGILLINRVKPHTDFGGAIGSGLLKMAVVGLGKHAGAIAFHRAAHRIGYERALRTAARLVLSKAPILGGLAIVENQRHEAARLAFVSSQEIEAREPGLAAEAAQLMPRLPVDEVDLLIVDRLGKDISGTGMDPSVIGRQIHGYSLLETPLPESDLLTGHEPDRIPLTRPSDTLSPSGGERGGVRGSSVGSQRRARPLIRRLFVRDLTSGSHGNATGIGMADFTTTRLVRAIDWKATYTNALTAMSLQGSKIPIHFDTDRECLAQALATLPIPDPHQAKIVRITDTLSVSELELSEAYGEEVRQRADLEIVSSPAEIRFDPEGNLSS